MIESHADAYRTIVAIRRLLLSDEEIPPDLMRREYLRTLDMCEELLVGLDQARDAFVVFLRMVNERRRLRSSHEDPLESRR
jgi:hypothetical protein